MQPEDNVQDSSEGLGSENTAKETAVIGAKPAIAESSRKKNGIFIVTLFCVLWAIGLWTVVDFDMKEQINELKTQNSELQKELDSTLTSSSDKTNIALNSDIALSLLEERSDKIKLANIYAKSVDSAENSYIVKYYIENEDYGEVLYVIFVQSNDNNWVFELPGFSGITDEQMNGYEILEPSYFITNDDQSPIFWNQAPSGSDPTHSPGSATQGVKETKN